MVPDFQPSPNFGERLKGPPRFVILHYTGMPTAQGALDWLRNPESQVSCHYFVFEDGGVVQLVDEASRAWHAGKSCWEGESDMNSASIGIEIAHPGHSNEAGGRISPYPEAQIVAVMRLVRDLMKRYAIPLTNVLAHSDIAPERKADPGEFFPWARLGKARLCLWVPPAKPSKPTQLPSSESGEAVAAFQHDLAEFGYCLAPSGLYDPQTEAAARAFQRRFRPSCVNGAADAQTRATLKAALARKRRTLRLRAAY